MEDLTVKEKIIEIIEQIRPFIIADGGDIEFVKYEENIVYVKLSGACESCSVMDYTLKDVIETSIIEELPEVKEVRTVN